jgi:sorbitol-specific phosphotransferase system component IIC
MYFVPFGVMLLCTVLTVKKLVVRQVSDNQQLANNAQRNRRISIMLLLMCLAYVVFTLPNRLCFSVFPNQIMGHAYTDTVFLASNTLMYTRNALNVFFLYISVVGFRRDIRQLMLTCRKRLTGQDVTHEFTGGDHLGTVTTLRDPTMGHKTTVAVGLRP